MKKEWFRRGTRMVHRFQQCEAYGDYLDNATFDLGAPISPSQRHSKSLTVQRFGEYRYLDPLSPVVSSKTGREASLNGPAPDVADPVAQTIPVGTVKRKFP